MTHDDKCKQENQCKGKEQLQQFTPLEIKHSNREKYSSVNRTDRNQLKDFVIKHIDLCTDGESCEIKKKNHHKTLESLQIYHIMKSSKIAQVK